MAAVVGRQARQPIRAEVAMSTTDFCLFCDPLPPATSFGQALEMHFSRGTVCPTCQKKIEQARRDYEVGAVYDIKDLLQEVTEGVPALTEAEKWARPRHLAAHFPERPQCRPRHPPGEVILPQQLPQPPLRRPPVPGLVCRMCVQ